MYIFNADKEMLRASISPAKSPESEAIVWMEGFFDTYGDVVPNADETIIPVMAKKDVWNKYMEEFNGYRPPLPTVGYSRFINLWNALFPNVRKRPWCSIPGKCDTCWRIDKARKSAEDSYVLKALQAAHLLHRGGMFMLQRKK